MKYIPYEPIKNTSPKKDQRLAQFFCSAPQKARTHIAGYPDDEGIKLNGGRRGAAQAPDLIRSYLYNMTPSFENKNCGPLYDHGNLNIQQGTLKERHESALTEPTARLLEGHNWVGIGGGHDYGYVEGSAFLTAHPNGVIVNFDAHFDVRPDTHGISSGTPFYRLYKKHGNFSFLELGIQEHCNSLESYEFVIKNGGQVCTYKDYIKNGLPFHFLKDIPPDTPCFLSVDIDVFSNSYAPGCSQSWGPGFTPKDYLKHFNWIHQNLNICCLGVYESSPPLDESDKTSKLAAWVIYEYLFRKYKQ